MFAVWMARVKEEATTRSILMPMRSKSLGDSESAEPRSPPRSLSRLLRLLDSHMRQVGIERIVLLHQIDELLM
eukprot:326663-Hanusia_phi.AAC.1